MKNIRYGLALLACGVLILGVYKIAVTQENPGEREARAPARRSFDLGLTYQPHDFTDAAFSETYDLIAKHADLIFHYMGDGVPWTEAADGKPYHPNVEKTFRERAARNRPGQKVGLGISFLDSRRQNLALYWGENDSMPRPGKWRNRSFRDPAVISAYLAYCRDLLRRFKPDYFIYGMEVDSFAFDPRGAKFNAIKNFTARVYGTLKAEYPDLPVLLSFVLLPEKEMREREVMTRALLQYSDMYAVSAYPYLFDGIGGNAEKLPSAFFSRVRGLMGDKPFAVAETGFNAKPWRVLSRFIWVDGKERWQAHYVRFLLEESQKLDARFVNWWVPRDLDALWEKMKASGADAMLSQWNSCGLADARGRPRKGLNVWDSWLALPVDR